MSNQQKDLQSLEDSSIKTLDEKDMKVIKGSWGCSITWNHRSLRDPVDGGLGSVGPKQII